jgi:sugar lactone lactonase YvrE
MTGFSPALEPKVLLDGLAMVESPRWHDSRLWFAHWGTGEIRAVDVEGNGEVMGQGPDGLGWTIDWLPDGRLLVTGKELLCKEPDGSAVQYADLRGIGEHGWSDIVVDGRGNVYVASIAFEFLAGQPPQGGMIALVTADGDVRQVAGDLAFPNGMVVTPDNSTLIISESFAGRLTAFDIDAEGSLSNRRVWAEGLGPDAICLDADGAIWVGTADTRISTGRDDSPGGAVVRIREGGEVLSRVEHDRPIFGCALGGPDRTMLFLLAADWRGTDQVAEVVAARTGQVLTVQAPAPGVGWP